MVECVLHASVLAVLLVEDTYKNASTDACKTFYTIPLYITIFLMMDPLVLNMKKTIKIKN